MKKTKQNARDLDPTHEQLFVCVPKMKPTRFSNSTGRKSASLCSAPYCPPASSPPPRQRPRHLVASSPPHHFLAASLPLRHQILATSLPPCCLRAAFRTTSSPPPRNLLATFSKPPRNLPSTEQLTWRLNMGLTRLALGCHTLWCQPPRPKG